MAIKSSSVAHHQATHKRSAVWWVPEEFEQLKANAKFCGLTCAEYIRRCCLDQKITPKSDTDAVNGLLKLGGLQVKLIQDLRQAGGSENKAIMQKLDALYGEIQIAIRSIRRG